MKRVGIAELKDHLSTHLRAVESGQEVEVTDRGRPIARIVPVPRPGATALISPTRPFAEVRDRDYKPTKRTVDSTELLLEERQGR